MPDNLLLRVPTAAKVAAYNSSSPSASAVNRPARPPCCDALHMQHSSRMQQVAAGSVAAVLETPTVPPRGMHPPSSSCTQLHSGHILGPRKGGQTPPAQPPSVGFLGLFSRAFLIWVPLSAPPPPN